jgi:hypothetical protein
MVEQLDFCGGGSVAMGTGKKQQQQHFLLNTVRDLLHAFPSQ